MITGQIYHIMRRQKEKKIKKGDKGGKRDRMNLLLADTSSDVAFSLSSSNFFALFIGVELDFGWDASTLFIAASLSDAGFCGSWKTNSASFSTLYKFASVGAAKTSFTIFSSILDSVSAERGGSS